MTPIKLRLDRRGSATMLMVFMVTVIMTVGLGFNWLVKEHLQASENLKNKAEAIVKARSAYDTLIYLLLRGRTMPREVVLSGTEDLTLLQTLPLDNAPIPLSDDVTVRIQDSNGLISLATINTAAMQQLLQRVLSVDSASVSSGQSAGLDRSGRSYPIERGGVILLQEPSGFATAQLRPPVHGRTGVCAGNDAGGI